MPDKASMSNKMQTYLEASNSLFWYKGRERADEHHLLAAFLVGLASGFKTYAWWKDGVQYVGTCGTTLAETLVVVDAEIERVEEMHPDVST